MPGSRESGLSRRTLLSSAGLLLCGTIGPVAIGTTYAGTETGQDTGEPRHAGATRDLGDFGDAGATGQTGGGRPVTPLRTSASAQAAEGPVQPVGSVQPAGPSQHLPDGGGPTGPAGLGDKAVPLVHTRAEWGAAAPKRPAKVLAQGPDHIVIHHTDTPNTDDLSLAHALLLSRQIQAFHMNCRGWDDIGEQLTISRGGHVMEGRDGSLSAILAKRNVLGAQTLCQNEHTLGIENEGTYMTAPVPPTLWSSLVRVCTWLCSLYGLDPCLAIVGHRDFRATDCPGDVLYGRLPELRRAVATGLGRTQLVQAPWMTLNNG